MKDTVLVSLIHLTHQALTKVEKVFLRLVNKFFWQKVEDPDAASACRTISLLLQDDQISEPMTRWFPRLGVQFPASFVSALVNRSTKNSYRRLPEWRIDDKLVGRNFARSLSLQTPDMLQKSVPCSDIEVATDTVIKPASGSSANGIYLVFSEKEMYEFASNTQLTSEAMLRKRLREHANQTGKDEWLVEACVTNHRGEPAHDLKFYCFYGAVGLIREIQRYPTKRFCFWDSKGRSIDVGRSNGLPFKGNGIPQEIIALAKRVSLEVPTPFIRIDFLNGREGVYFGEFTPRPGGFAMFDKSTDRRLGHLFLEAETRLAEDLLNGKSFETFKESTAHC